MKEFVQKLIKIEKEMSQEKGAFVIFALFMREDSLSLWDLVVCAPWTQGDEKSAALRYIVSKLKSVASTDEMVKLSHVAFVDKDNPGLLELQETFTLTQAIQHSTALVPVENFNGMNIERAYLITLAQAHSAA
jgi:hypothetical protein